MRDMYEKDSLDELHEDLYMNNDTEEYFWVSSPEELEVAKETKFLERRVIIYKEENNYEQLDRICKNCINKIIELHNGKRIIVDNETGIFTNDYLSTYYSFVIMLAYDCEPSDVVSMVNNHKKKSNKTKKR